MELGRPTERAMPMALTWTSSARGRFFFWSLRRVGLEFELSSSRVAEGAEVKEKILDTLAASLSEELDHGKRDIRLSFFFFLVSGLSASEVSGSVLSAEVV